MLPIVERTRESGAWNVPTMAVMAVNVGTVDDDELLARPELEYLAGSYVDDWLRLRGRANIPRGVATIIQDNRMLLLKLLHDRQARLLLGTDSPQLFNVPGFSIHRELRMMAAAGMSPDEVLRTGTQQVGVYLKRQCGTVTVGACADLVLLVPHVQDCHPESGDGCDQKGQQHAGDDVDRAPHKVLHHACVDYRVFCGASERTQRDYSKGGYDTPIGV
ncbi:MAG TPA: amidohydrolase family protein [Vicinamibacterales bacterium]|jgi:hypothetical protein